MTDFQTSDEEETFHDLVDGTTDEVTRLYVKSGWVAARDYFSSEDSEGSKEQPPADLDNRRIALQHAMNEAARPPTDPKKVVERANEFLAFLNGEDK